MRFVLVPFSYFHFSGYLFLTNDFEWGLKDYFYNVDAVLFFNIGLNANYRFKGLDFTFDGLKQGFVAHFLTSLTGAIIGSFLIGVLIHLLSSSSTFVVLISLLIGFLVGVAISRFLEHQLEKLMTPKVAGWIGGIVGGLLYGLTDSMLAGIFGLFWMMCFSGALSGFFDLHETSLGYLILSLPLLGGVLGFLFGFSSGFSSGRSMAIKGHGKGEARIHGGFLLGGFKGGGLFGEFGGGASGGGGAIGGW